MKLATLNFTKCRKDPVSLATTRSPLSFRAPLSNQLWEITQVQIFGDFLFLSHNFFQSQNHVCGLVKINSKLQLNKKIIKLLTRNLSECEEIVIDLQYPGRSAKLQFYANCVSQTVSSALTKTKLGYILS